MLSTIRLSQAIAKVGSGFIFGDCVLSYGSTPNFCVLFT